MDVEFVMLLTMAMATTLIVRGADVTSVFTQETPDTCLSGRHHKVSICGFSNWFLSCNSLTGIYYVNIQNSNWTQVKIDTNLYYLQIGDKLITKFGFNPVKLTGDIASFQKNPTVSEGVDGHEWFSFRNGLTLNKINSVYWKLNLTVIQIC